MASVWSGAAWATGAPAAPPSPGPTGAPGAGPVGTLGAGAGVGPTGTPGAGAVGTLEDGPDGSYTNDLIFPDTVISKDKALKKVDKVGAFAQGCLRRLNSDPPCRFNIDPGRIVAF
jgi:hypothetical protein